MRWTMDDIKEKGLKIAGEKSLVQSKPTPEQNYQALGRMKSGRMNKTEKAYNNHLEMQKRLGKVLWFEFEPMNLRLGNNCFYKVDFLVLTCERFLEVHEV